MLKNSAYAEGFEIEDTQTGQNHEIFDIVAPKNLDFLFFLELEVATVNSISEGFLQNLNLCFAAFSQRKTKLFTILLLDLLALLTLLLPLLQVETSQVDNLKKGNVSLFHSLS